MRYIPNTKQDRQAMLQAIGAGSVDELFADVPGPLRLRRALKIPPALAEAELVKRLRALAARNADADRYNSFLGAGCYDHFSPAIIGHLVSRGEFLTAYTPYQPEISQGTLQAQFEYQTLVCQLTGMEVSNASMYEGASATAEAVLMAHRITGRTEVVVGRAVHPEYRQVARTYAAQVGLVFREIPFTEAGVTDRERCARAGPPDRLPGGAVSQLLRRCRRARAAGRSGPRCRCAPGGVRGRADRPGPSEVARRVRRGPGDGGGAGARHRDELRRTRPGLPGDPRAVRAPPAGPAGGTDGGSGRPPGIRPHPGHARAAHPPREGHLQHLHGQSR